MDMSPDANGLAPVEPTLRPVPPDTGARYADGPPLHVVMNAGSGATAARERRETIVRVLGGAGRTHDVAVCERPEALAAVARAAVARARADGGVVVAAGGDGTINTVAQAVLGTGCTFGILPQGTFNYFARTHGVPLELEDAARALLDARVEPIRVGLVNDRVFLVNASVGLYPKVLQEREAWKRAYGRSRPVAMLAMLSTVLHGARPLRLIVEAGGVERTVRATTLFVGNNPLQLEQVGVPIDDAVGRGRLAAVVVRPIGVAGLLALAARGALGDLAESDDVEHFECARLDVRPSRLYRSRRIRVATDGEIAWLDAPLRFRVAPDAIPMLVPAQPVERR